MKQNQTMYAAGLLVILALIYFVTQTGAKATKSIDGDIFALEASSIDRIVLKDAEQTLEFVLDKGQWLLDGYPADTLRVQTLLQQVSALQVDRLLSKNPEKHAKYEASDTAPSVLVYSKGAEVLSLIIGKQGAHFQETVVRETDKDDLYIVKTSLASLKTPRPSLYWDKTITDLDPGSITRVLAEGEYSYDLQREGASWKYDGSPVDPEKVQALLKGLASLKGTNVSTTDPLQQPHYLTLTLYTELGDPLVLPFHFKDDGASMMLVRPALSSKTFEFSKAGLNRFDRSMADLLPEGQES